MKQMEAKKVVLLQWFYYIWEKLCTKKKTGNAIFLSKFSLKIQPSPNSAIREEYSWSTH